MDGLDGPLCNAMTTPPPIPSNYSHSRPLNLTMAGFFLLLALWTLVADLLFSFDIVFQTSSSSVLLALFVSMWLFAAIFTPIFPKRIVIAASVLVTLRVAMGWPLNYVMENTPAAQVMSGLTFALAAYYLFVSLRNGLKIGERPGFRLKHTLGMIAFWLVFGVVSVFPLLLGFMQGLNNFAGSYVDLSPRGLSLKERVFEKDGKRVRLTGMVHIADSQFYQNLTLNKPLPESERHLVLTEGVSDRNEILPEAFASGETYANVARKLGLEPQKDPQPEPAGEGERPTRTQSHLPQDIAGVTYLNADMDVSELSQKHQDLLVSLLTFLDEAELQEMFGMPEGMTAADIHDLFAVGLLQTRNDHLMNVLNEELADYDEVHIPWGAAHLPDIEERLLNDGYSLVEDAEQPAIDFLKRFK